MRSAFKLPFQVHHPAPGFLSAGGTARLVFGLRVPVDEAGITALSEAVHLLAQFGATGALAGAHIEPWNSGLTLQSVSASAADVLEFDLSDCRADDHAVVVLTDLLLHVRLAPLLRRIEILTPTSRPSRQLELGRQSSYPERFAALPFTLVDEEPEGGGYSFAMQLAEPLTEVGREALNVGLSLWQRMILSGGYALAPIPPEENYVEWDAGPIDFDTTVEWAVAKLRAHPACLDALFNLLAAFHGRVQRVQSVVVS
jgi:hypothetical protein